MSEPEATEQTSSTQEAPRIGSPNLTNTHEPESEVKPIEAAEDDSDPTFRAVYTGFDDDLEVELVKRVPATKSEHQFGHAIIDRPEWDESKKALLQNVRVDVLNEDTEAELEVEIDG
ncbi:hypothetical protein [Halosimplex pelagicum]|uniref:Uncharacterized protein n=1 Tax=Halosimplex pelagicum TaxID=869886 RepID=A0A7D5P6V1_9EURY|nr:hypothetical protein [Halosimplex pelagicum]QLH82203.1 hypothetical protein HZS54_11555 [Halosimplex pelagicum]